MGGPESDRSEITYAPAGFFLGTVVFELGSVLR